MVSFVLWGKKDWKKKKKNCDKTYILKLWKKTQTFKLWQNSNCDKTQKSKCDKNLKNLFLTTQMGENSKTQNVRKLKMSQLKKFKLQHHSKPQIVTKRNISNCDKPLKKP